MINRIIFANILITEGFEMRENRQWIWQYEEYPKFEYDFDKLDDLMQSVSRKQGELMALSRVIGSKTWQRLN